MTTKYTDEQIIAYLRTLREGDVLTAVADSDEYYTAGKRYTVEKDSDGDKYVTDNESDRDYVNYSEGYREDFYEYVRDGIFDIPAQSTGYIEIDSVIHNGTSDDRRRYSIRITANEAGYEAIRALEADSVKSEALAQLKAERDALQAQIDEIERSLEAV